MAIDFGEKRLGVAVSDVTGTLALPVTVISRAGKSKDLKVLSDLINKYKVEKIIVGNPLTLAGRVGPQSQIATEFARLVESAFNMPVETTDERLSTAEARRRLSEAGIDERNQRGKIDQIAASLILQNYLDRQAGGFTDKPI